MTVSLKPQNTCEKKMLWLPKPCAPSFIIDKKHTKEISKFHIINKTSMYKINCIEQSAYCLDA